MKKAGKILLIIAGVFLVISVVSLLVMAICFFIAPSVPQLKDLIQEGLQKAREEVTNQDLLNLIEWACQEEHYSAFSYGVGSGLLVSMFIDLIAAVMAFIGSGAKQKGMFIVNIIFGFFSSSLLQIIGGILGLIGAGQKEEKPQVVGKSEEQVEREEAVEPASEDEKEPEKPAEEKVEK